MERNLILDGIYGLAVADALGVPYESETLESMTKDPCMGMTGFRHHNQPAGSWSDDTSMSLCVADSLCKGFDPDDMMKRFSRWRGKAEYTAAGKVFDVGRTTRRAINKFHDGYPAEYSGDRTIDGNGNGGLMRTFPIALYQYVNCKVNDDCLEEFLTPIHKVSELTHAHEIGLICCGLFSLTLREWLDHSDQLFLETAQRAFDKGIKTYRAMGDHYSQHLHLFTEPQELIHRTAEELPSWGYALNTWNIALWSLLTTTNYRDCVLKAINVGGDTDTNGAVAGALAGVIYGKDQIPVEWMDALLNRQLIDEVCVRFGKSVLGIREERGMIDQFQGEYAFLSMKAPGEITIDGFTYKNIAAGYYALSVADELREQFEYINAKKARKLYKELPHSDLTEDDLYRVVKVKYEQNTEFRSKLLETAPMEIIYDTTGSHDNFLGRCRCDECRDKEHKNVYGKILMRVRDGYH